MWGTVPGSPPRLWLSSGPMQSGKILLAGKTWGPQRAAGSPRVGRWGGGGEEGSLRAGGWALARKQGGHLPSRAGFHIHSQRLDCLPDPKWGSQGDQGHQDVGARQDLIPRSARASAQGN